MEIKRGDTVQLRSGGPIMTVENIERDKVNCVWFNNKEELQYDIFNIVLLNNVEVSDT